MSQCHLHVVTGIILSTIVFLTEMPLRRSKSLFGTDKLDTEGYLDPYALRKQNLNTSAMDDDDDDDTDHGDHITHITVNIYYVHYNFKKTTFKCGYF